MSIYKDENGKTYYFILRIKKENGDIEQIKRRGFKSRLEASRAEAEMLLDSPEDVNNITFEFIANEYMEWYGKRRKASSTLKISNIIKTHLIPRFGNKKIEDIRARDVTRYQDDIIDKFAPAHVKKIHSVLSATFNYAMRQEYTKNNPARTAGNVDIETEKRMEYWTLDEFKEFIKHVGDPVYYALFMTLYYSGMRKGELLALTWADIDFDNDMINVDKTEYNRVVTTPKTKSSIRKLYMPKHVMTLLSRLKATRKPKMSYVVFGEFHDSISTSTLDVRYAEYIKISGVKRIRLHDFRHSHSSYLINQGTIITVVAKRLGHSDVSTTLNVYSHLFPSTEKEAILSMEDDFKSAQIIEFKSKEK